MENYKKTKYIVSIVTFPIIAYSSQAYLSNCGDHTFCEPPQEHTEYSYQYNLGVSGQAASAAIASSGIFTPENKMGRK